MMMSTQEIQALFLEKVVAYGPERFLEVGCFEGNTSRTVKTTLPNCEVVAYEADPRNYIYFNSDIQSSNVKHVWAGISNFTGKENFYLQSVPGKMNHLWGNNSLNQRNDDYTKYVEFPVDVYTLDTLHNPEKTTCMWVDAEGCAYEVLEGAVSLLKNVQCMLIEVESTDHWTDQKMDADVISLLEDQGFTVIARDQEYPQQYNILVERK